MKKQYLLTPGPAPVPEEIMKAMSEPIIHHRTSQYRDIVWKINQDIKKIFRTDANVLTFTSSGTGAMEASVTNTLSKGDTAIVVRGGKFGERFSEICRAFGVEVVPIDVEWGTRPHHAAIEKALKEHPEAKAVFIQLCETSTATLYDVKSIGSVVKNTRAILVVDAISGLGADEFFMDEWGVDIAIGGSQKGFMLPPGLAFLAVSGKAWKLAAASKLPKFYFDLKRYEKVVTEGDSPWTPAITLVLGLGKAVSMILDEGVDKFVARHAADAAFVRQSLSGMGLEVFSKYPSDALTAIKVPQGLDGKKIVDTMKTKSVIFAGGQGHLKGKIFRIAHMGAITREDLEHALEKLKETLAELGHKVK
ncbi:MAG: alanine--glyoxylate aminotransferase family protein [Candidatus Omnitrophica bacterium]|nr:alanine--glyoxylate aminotransferase family protein [Candidatus Omnitrophota bacterium]